VADTVIITGEKTVTVVTVGVQGPAGISGSSVPATNTTIGGIIVGANLSITGNGLLSTNITTNLPYANITGTPTLAAVATSGSYTDLANLPTITNTFNGRSGNVTLTANDVTTLVNANYLQVYKDTQANESTLTQFGLSSFIQSGSLVSGYSRGLLTSNVSGTTTRSIFDGNVYQSSATARYPAFKRIAFNSNNTSGATSTGRIQLNDYGAVFIDSQTVTSGSNISRVSAFSAGSATSFQNSGDILLTSPGVNFYAYKSNNDGTNVGAEQGSFGVSEMQRGVSGPNGTYISRPYTVSFESRNTWPVADTTISYSYTPNYRTFMTIGDSAELFFQNYGNLTTRNPTWTSNSILTQGYADTRYQAVGTYLTSANLTFANLTSTPTTLAGYGITDGLTSANLTPYLTISSANATYSVLGHAHAIANVTGLQTALDAKLETANFSYANLTGKPSTFTPSAHNHAISDVTGLQTALDAKLPSANFTYANITGKPTFATVATSGNYTDLTGTPNLTVYLTTANATATYLPSANFTYANITGTPNLTVYLTTANASTTYQLLGNYATTSCLTFSNITGKPTTLSGYGITDGYSTSNPSGFITAGANSFTGTQNLGGNLLTQPKLQAYRETSTAPTISSGTLTLDLSGSNFFAVSLNAAITTLTISNTPASSAASFTLELTADGTARAVTWGSAIKWAGGTAPTLTSTSGKKDVFAFYSNDGGTTWQGFIGGQNY
jgi:hypothetical protein